MRDAAVADQSSVITLEAEHVNAETSHPTKNRLRPNQAALVTAAVFLLLSLPVVLMPYGRLDDYTQLLWVQSDGARTLVEWSMTFGRPVNFIMNGALFRLAESVEGLWLARTVAALGFALAAFVLAIACSPVRRSSSRQIAVSALVFALPGTWVFISWAQGAGHGMSLLFAALACYLALIGYQLTGWRRLTASGLAVSLVFAAMFGYQTFGLAIPGLILGSGLLSRRREAALWMTVFAIPVTILAFGANVLLVRTRATDVLSSRTSLSTDWAGKVEWITQELLPRVLWPFSLTPRPVMAAVIAVVALVLIAVSGAHARQGACLRRWTFLLGVAAIAAVLPLAPLLVIGENWASARAVFAPALILWLLLLALAFQACAATSGALARPRWRPVLRSLAPIVIAAALVFAGVFSAYRAYVSLAVPATLEWAETRTLWAAAPATTTGAEVQLQPFVLPDVPYVAYDEYGIPTGSVAWAAPSMHVLAAKEIADLQLDPTQVTMSDVPGTCDSGPLVEFDTREMELRLNPNRLWSCGLG